MEEDKNRAKTLSLLRRMIHEISSGYEPDFLVIGYPAADSKHIIKILGFTGMKSAYALHELLQSLDEDLRESLIEKATGLTLKDLEKVEERFDQDIKRAMERAADSLQKDKPVKDLKLAQAMLAKIMKERDEN